MNAQIGAIAFEAQARLIAAAKLGSAMRLQGFLSARTRRSRKLVLHLTNMEFIEGA